MPLALAIVMSTATGAAGAPGADIVAPASVRWTSLGEAALGRSQPGAAIDAFETALAVDPKNARAFVGIAHAYDAQGLPGRAIKYYREALALEPNDLVALEGQGKALVARGATDRAKLNLARIKTLCTTECPAAKRLEVAIATPVLPAKTAATDAAKPATAKN